MLSVLSPKKFGIRRIPRLGTEGLKNEIGHVMKKIYTFKGQKYAPRAQKRNLGPKISMVVWYVHRSGVLHGTWKNILLGVKKAKIGPQSQKRNLGPKISMVVWYIHWTGILHGVRKNLLYRVEKAKIAFTELRPQNSKHKFPHLKDKNKQGRTGSPKK
jgi:hypothetical protein